MKFKVLSKKNTYFIKVKHNDPSWVEVINLDCKDSKSAYNCFVDLHANSTFKDLPMALFGHSETDYVLSTDTD